MSYRAANRDILSCSHKSGMCSQPNWKMQSGCWNGVVRHVESTFQLNREDSRLLFRFSVFRNRHERSMDQLVS